MERHDGAPIVCRLDGTVEDMRTLRAAAWLTTEVGAHLLAINVSGEEFPQLPRVPFAVGRRTANAL